MWQDWQTENPKVDDDHLKLGRMVASLSVVIANGGTPTIVAEAIDVLRERLRLHFRMEEAVAGKADLESRAILEGDHAQLLTMLDGLAAAACPRGTDLGSRLDAFIKAAERHEAEVDVPLFHLLAAAEPGRAG
ncbi:MAG: hemerythrin domain-containing protein [Magnetospirillum sp.]|nr:hemerythrin domain-containing protein [Magnetospirillum sp.]